MSTWYARPVVHVADMARSLAFYLGELGFSEDWRFEENATRKVIQVSREGCDLILTSQWPDKAGAAVIFVSLDPDLLDAVRAEYETGGVDVHEGRWGYRLMVIADPDGNKLWFPYPEDE